MQHIDTKTEIARIATSSAVITIAGVTLNEWVAIFTIVYLFIQCIILAPKALEVTRRCIRKLRGIKEPNDD